MTEYNRIKNILMVCSAIAIISFVWYLYDMIVPAYNNDNNPEIEEVLCKVLSDEGINSCDSEINAFYFYGNAYLSDEKKEEILENIAKNIGINNEYEYNIEKTENGSLTEINKKSTNANITLKLITYEIEESKNILSLRHYISVDMTIKDSIASSIYYKEKIQDTLSNIIHSKNQEDSEDYPQDKVLSLSIKGKMMGKLTNDSQKRIADSIINLSEAKKIFDHTSDNGYCVYGYTKNIADYITVGNKQINLNVAYSYDEDNDCTTIHIASPIVNYDY